MVWGGSTMNSVTHLHHETRVSRRSNIRPWQFGADSDSAREAFPCFYLCDECGYLCATRPACPSCGRSAWIDLNLWAHAEALRSREEDARRHPPSAVKWRVRAVSIAAGATIGLGCAAGLALASLSLAGAPVLLGLGAGALTHGLGRRRLGWSIMSRRVDDPTRWRVPLPLADPGARWASRALGRVEPREALLRAPFSGRPCVAYDVAILFDTPHDAWPPIWVLREMRSCAFELQGRTIAADRVSLALPQLPVDRPVMDEAQRQRFLRERGLFATDGEFTLFEAIVEPGASHELLWPAAPADAPPVLRATTETAPGSPYR